MVFAITKSAQITRSEEVECVWRQILTSIIAALPLFTHGLETTSLTSTPHWGAYVTDHYVGNRALIVVGAVTALLHCYVADKIGRKTAIYFISLLQGVSCIPLFLTPSEMNIIVLHVLVGASASGLFTVIPLYIREISSDKIRGATTSVMILMMALGYSMKVVVCIEVMMYIMVAMITMQMLLMMYLLESPSYLVMKRKLEDAKTCLAKLKRLNANDNLISREVYDLKDQSENITSKGNLTIYRIWKNKIWWDITKIGVALFSTTLLCGSILFLDYNKVLAQINKEDDLYQFLLPSCLLAGAIICSSVIMFVDRKYLLTFAYSSMALSMGILAVYTQEDLTVTSLRWVPVVALSVLVIGYGIVWGLPTIILVEMLNLEIRASILGSLYAYGQILKLILVETFPDIEEYVKIYSLLYIFASINMYGAVYSLFIVPNIKGKSVKQIETQLKRLPLIK